MQQYNRLAGELVRRLLVLAGRRLGLAAEHRQRPAGLVERKQGLAAGHRSGLAAGALPYGQSCKPDPLYKNKNTIATTGDT